MSPVEARERLNRLNARQWLVDVHGVHQRLVVAGLKFVGADQEAVRVFLNLVGYQVRREAVERYFGDLHAAMLVLAGESNHSPVRALAL